SSLSKRLHRCLNRDPGRNAIQRRCRCKESSTVVNLQLLGVRRPVGALVPCDLSQSASVESLYESGARAPQANAAPGRAHSKELDGSPVSDSFTRRDLCLL